MSDTNVVSTEDGEMSKVREVFDRALNAIIAATALAKEVEQLRNDVQSLRNEVESFRSREYIYNQQITQLRNENDQLHRDKQAAIDELNQVRHEAFAAQASRDSWQASHGELSDIHESLKRDHDHALVQNLELEEENKQLKAKLEQVKAVFGIQPRDVTSGQWQSPSVVVPHVEEATPEADAQRTGTDNIWR